MSIKIQSKEIQEVSVSQLTPHPKNMNQHSDDQIERLCKIIEYQGFRNPLIVQKGTNLVVAGHGRIMAAKKLGIDKVPVMYQEFESEEQLYAAIVSDNSIASWAELDLSMVNAELENLGPDLDIDLLGIKNFTIEPMDNFTEPDYSILDDMDGADIKDGVKKAVMIEFDLDDYNEAYEEIKYWRTQGLYVGEFLIKRLKQERAKNEN